MWIEPGELSYEKTSRSEGKELKHVVETRRTHVVPALRVSVPVRHDDERGRMCTITYVTRCVGVHRMYKKRSVRVGHGHWRRAT